VDAALAKFIKIRGNVLSGYGVIGGDDKCGIFIALTLACANLCNFVFSVEEESGGHGIKTFVAEQDLSDIPYGLVLDRRGNADIICTKNSYGVAAFERILLEIGKIYGYKESSGTFSDANFLSEKISCANLSVGYYNPHSKSEFVDIDDLKIAMNFTNAIIKNVTEKFEAPSKTNTYTYTYPAKPSQSAPFRPFSHSYPGDVVDVELGDICAFCNTQKEKTIFSKVVNDFVCIDCCRQLREEILEYDGLFSQDGLEHISEYDEMMKDKEDVDIDKILNDIDDGQIPIGFDDTPSEDIVKEHHSKPTESIASSIEGED
jgi:hypothetical protein